MVQNKKNVTMYVLARADNLHEVGVWDALKLEAGVGDVNVLTLEVGVGGVNVDVSRGCTIGGWSYRLGTASRKAVLANT